MHNLQRSVYTCLKGRPPGVLSCGYPLRVIDLAYSYPLQSLQGGCWFKLICGASFQHLPAVRNLTLAYALAGADCIDVAADPAVVAAARDGIRAMTALARDRSVHDPEASVYLPWLMVSLNDGEDPHFRKVTFDPERCPPDCHRPCEPICPAQAIVFSANSSSSLAPALTPPQSSTCQGEGGAEVPLLTQEGLRGVRASSPSFLFDSSSPPSGVIRDRCYGCGRCIPVCPIQHIEPQSYVVSPEAIAPALLPQVDAIEIHTQVGRTDEFRALWHKIRPYIDHLKLVAVSCPDNPMADSRNAFVDYLRSLHQIMTDDGQQPLPGALLWQTDGRPMSGDIGKGTTHAAVRLAQKAIAAQLPGFVQLAGGTNAHTVPTLRQLRLLSHPPLAGVAYGSYARKLLSPVLDGLAESQESAPVHHPEHRPAPFPQAPFPQAPFPQRPISSHAPLSNGLETVPELLREAVHLATSLVSPLKGLTQGRGAIAPLPAKTTVSVMNHPPPPVADGSASVGSSYTPHG